MLCLAVCPKSAHTEDATRCYFNKTESCPQTLHVDYMVRASHSHTRVNTNYTGLKSLLQSCKSRVHLHIINLSSGVSFKIFPVFTERPTFPSPSGTSEEAEEVCAEEHMCFSRVPPGSVRWWMTSQTAKTQAG